MGKTYWHSIALSWSLRRVPEALQGWRARDQQAVTDVNLNAYLWRDLWSRSEEWRWKGDGTRRTIVFEDPDLKGDYRFNVHCILHPKNIVRARWLYDKQIQQCDYIQRACMTSIGFSNCQRQIIKLCNSEPIQGLFGCTRQGIHYIHQTIEEWIWRRQDQVQVPHTFWSTRKSTKNIGNKNHISLH